MFFLTENSQAQTVGLFNYSDKAFEGYTLIAGFSQDVFLIDNCGLKVHQWSVQAQPGMSTYLLEDGRLLRAGRTNSSFSGGGSGGLVQIYGWESELLWSYRFTNDFEHQHHDLEILPNGNILVLAWDLVLVQDAVALGRDPELLTDDGIWLEKVVEIEPIGTEEMNIVWTWRLKDHIVQDRFPSLSTFGDIAENFRKLDINFPIQQDVDIIHCNSIDYNPVLDQIVLSSRNLSEIWIIDHSVTTEEAAGDDEGKYGIGGDFLYRWGNPQVYQRGDEEDKISFGQHDASWILEGLPGEGNITLYNNGTSRIGPDFSEALEISLPLNEDGSYQSSEEEAFEPATVEWVYGNPDDQFFFSTRMSGVQRLENGNTLICSADQGRLFEVDDLNEIVWEYVSPVSAGGIITQGNQAVGNSLFRAYRYGLDFPAFEDKTLIPTVPIELNPLDYDCLSVDTEETQINQGISINNPISDVLVIDSGSIPMHELAIYNLQGQKVYHTALENSNNKSINTSFLASGNYFLRCKGAKEIFTKTFIKL